MSVNEALLAFAIMDHALLLGLANLDIHRIRALCAFSGSECTPEGMVYDDDIVPIASENTPCSVIGGDGLVAEGAGGGVGGKGIGDDATVITGEKVVVESGEVVGVKSGGLEKVGVEGGGESDGEDGGGEVGVDGDEASCDTLPGCENFTFVVCLYVLDVWTLDPDVVLIVFWFQCFVGGFLYVMLGLFANPFDYMC